MRLAVDDGRVFVGKLWCVDSSKNFILYEASEYREVPIPGSEALDRPLE